MPVIASNETASLRHLWRVIACVALCAVLPASSSAFSGLPVAKLGPIHRSAPLSRVYGLGVSDVPAPPDVSAKLQLINQRCPVEVRAIITGDSRETTFAVLGWGEQSKLLWAGQGVKTPAGWIAISSIASDHVVLRRGDEAYHCKLGNEHHPKR
jgi:hypothetical protein